jgi:hypothetical protein
MSTIVTRAGKGSPLTWNEVDNNFTNLNTDKYQSGNNVSFGTIAGSTVTSSALTSGRVTFASTGGLLADNANLVWDNTNARLGIGTASPATALHLANGNFRLTNGTAFTTSNALIREINAAAGSSNQFVTSSIGFNTGAFTDSGIITFSTASSASTPTERMRLDSSGNLGLGVTPSTWFTGAKAIQVGATGSIFNNGSNNTSIGNNVVINDSNSLYLTTREASYYRQLSGQHQWFNAPSGTAGTAATFTQAMTLDSSGNLGLGVTPSAWAGKALQISGYNVLWNTGDGTYYGSNYFFNGTNRVYLNSSKFALEYLQWAADGSHRWYTAPSGTAGGTVSFSERMQLNVSGNLGLGVTPSAWGSGYKAIQSTNGASFGDMNGYTSVASNYFNNGSGDKYIANGYASRYLQSGIDGIHRWYTAPSGTAGNAITFTQAMTLDASGNLLVGLTSPYSISGGGTNRITAGYNQNGRVQIAVTNSTNGASAGAALALGSYGADWIIENGALGKNSNALTFTKDTTTAMTLDSGGTLWTGGGNPTVPTGLTGFANGIFVAGSAANTSLFYTSAGVGAGVPIQVTRLNDGGGIYFFRNGSTAGNISIATGTISVNNASDYRLKDNVESLSGSLKKIMQVRPVTFTWKENGSAGKSVIAHELQKVFPEVVSGEKDATNEDGSIKTQSVALGNLMPDLISAIQEQQAMIDELKAKVAALEAA